MSRLCFPLSWELARKEPGADLSSDWIPAVVPGAVQLDWARAHAWPAYWVGDNIRQWQGLENSAWVYRTRLDSVPSLRAGQRLFLVLGSVDYACDVRIDDVVELSHEGMQTPVEVELTSRTKAGSVITVHLSPAPMADLGPEPRRQASHTCKPAVAYGWDFHPRLIPLGLWRETRLEVRDPCVFATRPEVHYSLNETCTHVTGQLAVELSAPALGGQRLRWRFQSPSGRLLAEADRVLPEAETAVSVPFAFNVQPDELWWPHDQGQPVLHTSEVQLLSLDDEVVDESSRRVGFRHMRLVMAPGQWDYPGVFPKSRSHPPVTIEINGRAIFGKGSNWVCPDIFPGTLTPERYAAQLALVRAANLNLLRLWGGATAPHDCFYEQCDELGVMLWQEFPLSCNPYPDAADYLALLDRESRGLILRLRGHASVIMWCGGNELFNEWSRMTDQSLPLRLLNRNCYDLDPQRPFLPTAPLDGMGHGHYVFRDLETGEEAWSIFQRSACTAYSEFGCPGPAPLATLRAILPEAERWPPRPGTAWETHHGLGAQWKDSWLHLPHIEHYFGPCSSIEDMVAHGQALQGAGFQGLFEEARRQKPVASLAMNWCFNEPWPCVANNSLVAWPCEPKPALTKVAAACRPTLASARIRKFSWSAGEAFDPELWLLHDAPSAHAAVRVEAWLELDGQRHALATWQSGALVAQCNQRGPQIRFMLPTLVAATFTLQVEVAGYPEWNSTYLLVRAREDT